MARDERTCCAIAVTFAALKKAATLSADARDPGARMRPCASIIASAERMASSVYRRSFLAVGEAGRAVDVEGDTSGMAATRAEERPVISAAARQI